MLETLIKIICWFDWEAIGFVSMLAILYGLVGCITINDRINEDLQK